MESAKAKVKNEDIAERIRSHARELMEEEGLPMLSSEIAERIPLDVTPNQVSTSLRYGDFAHRGRRWMPRKPPFEMGKPGAEGLAKEIRKKYSLEEIKKIIKILLTVEDIKEPPEMIQNYAESIAMRESMEGGNLNMTDEQAWEMVQKRYFKTVVDEE